MNFRYLMSTCLMAVGSLLLASDNSHALFVHTAIAEQQRLTSLILVFESRGHQVFTRRAIQEGMLAPTYAQVVTGAYRADICCSHCFVSGDDLLEPCAED